MPKPDPLTAIRAANDLVAEGPMEEAWRRCEPYVVTPALLMYMVALIELETNEAHMKARGIIPL
jgi:hypothetical protein